VVDVAIILALWTVMVALPMWAASRRTTYRALEESQCSNLHIENDKPRPGGPKSRFWWPYEDIRVHRHRKPRTRKHSFSQGCETFRDRMKQNETQGERTGGT
jgi:hypothetical protein